MISIKLNIDEKPYTVSMITSPCSLFNEQAHALSLSLTLFLWPSHSTSLFLFQCSLTRYFSLSRTHSHSHTLSRSSSFSRILSLTLSRPCAFISLLSRIFLSVVFRSPASFTRSHSPTKKLQTLKSKSALIS